jgi:hypothetical protein
VPIADVSALSWHSFIQIIFCSCIIGLHEPSRYASSVDVRI